MSSNRLQRSANLCCGIIICLISVSGANVWAQTAPKPPGNIVDLGGHRLHLYCIGRGAPTVVVENGLGDFSFDWILVQSRVSQFTRICTYDRAGYAWSEPGPKPRTYAQLNLELRDALRKLGEDGPFMLVGHSFGGPVVRNFASTYPRAVVGIVFVDAAQEDLRYVFRGKAILLRSGEQGRPIPAPREKMTASDLPHALAQPAPAAQPLDPLYDPLPALQKSLQLWAQSLPQIDDAENSQREWSPEYLEKWHDSPQNGVLGGIPILVLTRANGGFATNLDIPADQLEQERLEGQHKLTLLSTNSKQLIVRSGHNMELEAPDAVASAIREIVEAIRQHRKL